MRKFGLLGTSALRSAVFAGAAIAVAAPAAAQTETQQVEAQTGEAVRESAEDCASFPTTVGQQACLDRLASAAARPAPGAPQEEAIVVTGSRIRRPNFDSPQPAVVIGSEQIEQRGYTNLGEALEELPAFGVPGSSPVGTQSGAFGSGQSFINFFGLGSQRTLTVVNGRRFVSSNTASIFGPTASGSQVDFNVIPTLIVDRVETIAVGGAPIYGSDAIAGTVNILTKRTFDGISLDAQYGITEQGDVPEYRLGALVGRNFGGDRGNITIAAEYNERGGLELEDRPNSGLGFFFTTPPAGSEFNQVLIRDRRIPALSQFGIPLRNDFIPLSPGQVADFRFNPNISDPQGRALRFNSNGDLVPIDFGERTGNLINFNGGNGFALPGNLLTDARRYLGTALAQYELTDNIRVFGEAWYANSKGTQLRAQPVYNTRLFGRAGSTDGNFIININNPFLTDAARATLRANLPANRETFFVTRANTDLASGVGSTEVELYRFVAGFDGTVDMFGREMTFEVVGNYGKSVTEGRSRSVVQQNFLNALDAVRDANGNIVCRPGFTNSSIATVSSTCVPFNPFGQQNSQAVVDYITTVTDPRAENDQKVVTASLSGDLFDLWAGPVGFAVGYEHREESAEFDPGAFFFGETDPANPTGPRRQFGRSIPIDPVFGEFNTDEVFAELTVPLLGRDQNIPFVYSLELNGAFRYINHSIAGEDPTYTIGATFQPIRDITFRGNYTRSVRAPAITELFNPSSAIFTTANDPCDARFRNAGPNPQQRQANCAAAGLPADFQSNIVDFTSRGALVGNTELTNEKADAWTVGAILRPSFLPGFSLAVDWVDIELEDAVQSLNAVQTLQACYDSPTFPDPICNRFTRDEQGQITFINTGFANAASRDFQGLIAELAWRIGTPFLGADSSVNIGVNYLYNDQLEFRVGQGDLTTLRGAFGYSKHQATTNVTYRNDNFAWQVQAQYIGPAVFDPDEEPDNRDFRGADDVVFFNTSLSFNVDDRYTFRFIVDNVFDEEPPFPSTASGNARATYFDGILGRNFKVSARVNF